MAIASGGSDNTAKVWDFPVATPLRQLELADASTRVAVSADGKIAAGTGKDGAIQLWNSADGKKLFTLAGHAGPVLGLAFHPNGSLLASLGVDRTLRFWNPTTGKPVATVVAHSGTPNGLVFAPGGNPLYTSSDDGNLKAWNIPSTASRELAAPHKDAVTALALSADNNSILSGCADKTVRISSFGNGTLVRSLEGASGPSRRWQPRETASSSPREVQMASCPCGTSPMASWSPRRLPHTGPVLGLASVPTAPSCSPAALMACSESGPRRSLRHAACRIRTPFSR